MRYRIDHDLHIHSRISLCSNDPEQSNERILQYAKENGLEQICLTDHFWDERVSGACSWYNKQNFAHISAALPLPKADGVEFLFGAETDLNQSMTVGVSRARFDDLAFVIIPTTHLHMTNNISAEDAATPEGRAKVWVSRLDGLLDMDLPFQKIGIAHLACGLIAKTQEDYLRVMELLPEQEMERIFAKAAQKGVGIELNQFDALGCKDHADVVMRPFRIAKAQGCKFYLGSDAHHPEDFQNAIEAFRTAIDYLDLTEADKFHISQI